MGDHLVSSITSIAVAIVGVAIIAVLVSKNAQTGSVIGSAGQAFAQDLSAAVSPVTGGGSGFGIGSSFAGGGVGSISNF